MGEVQCERTGQRLRSVSGAEQILVKRSWVAHHTDWAVAKIVYETGMVLLPQLILSRVSNAFEQLKSFIKTQQRRNIFIYERLQLPAARVHAVELIAGENSFDISVWLFAREHWRLHFDVLQSGEHDELPGCSVRLSDDFSLPGEGGIQILIDEGDEMGAA